MSYRGDMIAREALARSVNTVAVKLLNQTGIKTAFPYLAKLHFSSLCYADTTILSTGLGGFTYGVKVVDMAKGYATLANGGRYSSNTCLRQIKRKMDQVSTVRIKIRKKFTIKILHISLQI